MLKKLIFFTVILWVFLVCSGCEKRYSRDAWLKDWLHKPVCQPPCWQNIIPGSTTLADGRELALQIKGSRTTFAGEEGFDANIGEHSDVSLYSDTKGVINDISIRINDNNNLRIRDIVQKYGFPEKIAFSFYMPDEPEFNLLYPELGMVITTYPMCNPVCDSNSPEYDITAEERIIRIGFYLPGLDGYFKVWDIWIDTPIKTEPWKGYGHYSYSN